MSVRTPSIIQGILGLGLVLFMSVAPARAAQDQSNILPEKERAAVRDGWLRWRLDKIVPSVMRRAGIDMWIVMNREYAEDPVYLSLMPATTMASGGTAIVIFHDRGPEKGVERLCCMRRGLAGGLYPTVWTAKEKTQFEALAAFIKERNPRKIGIDVSEGWPLADGLSATLRDRLVKAIGPELSKRLVSAEDVCVGWLETRSPAEQSVYRHLCGIAHDVIAEFYSNAVITPDITTTEDVEWWIRQRFTDLGIDTWFMPSISIQRSAAEAKKYADRDVIRRGDLLHCDVGIQYLGLCTDMQLSAYILRTGETAAPQGLRNALTRANRVAEILMAEFKQGRSGNEITKAAMEKATAEELRPSIYSHPIGFHGHAAGMTMDARPIGQIDEGNPLRWNYPLQYETAFSIELSSTTSVPEWDGLDVRIGFEEDILFTEQGCRWIDGHQTEMILIR
jgi:Xaa-Pro aminopeptidase